MGDASRSAQPSCRRSSSCLRPAPGGGLVDIDADEDLASPSPSPSRPGRVRDVQRGRQVGDVGGEHLLEDRGDACGGAVVLSRQAAAAEVRAPPRRVAGSCKPEGPRSGPGDGGVAGEVGSLLVRGVQEPVWQPAAPVAAR